MVSLLSGECLDRVAPENLLLSGSRSIAVARRSAISPGIEIVVTLQGSERAGYRRPATKGGAAAAASTGLRRRALGLMPYRSRKATLKRRRLSKPLAKAISVTGSAVSARRRLA